MKKYLLATIIIVFSLRFAFAQEKLNEDQKLTTLCKVWGFLKYYHPSVAKGKLMWDEELINKIAEVEKANSKQDINEIYKAWLAKLGEVPKIDIPATEKEYFEKNFNLNWIKDQSVFTDNVIEKLTFIEQNRNQDSNYYITKKGNKLELTNELNFANSFPTKEIRIVEFFRFWNLIEYFYPHKYKIEEDWSDVLALTIPKILNCKNHTSYHLLYVELLNKLKDSHAYFYSQPLREFFGIKVLPVVSKYADGKLIITAYVDKKLANENNLMVGDVISKVNNLTIDAVFENKKKYIIAGNDAKKMKLFTDLDYFFNSSKDTVSLTIERENKTFNTTVKRYFRKDLDKTNQEAVVEKIKWKKLEDNIGYVNMENSDIQDIESIYNDLKDTKAIIFDIRNYPNFFGKEVVEKFGKSKKVFSKYARPDLNYPGKFYWQDNECGIEKQVSPYSGKIIILVNENSQSRSEWTAMQLQTLDNSFVIGSQTAGADGEMIKFKLNSGESGFTTNGVFYPNKEETQACGIKIDLEVKPTLNGLKANKDEVLDQAIAFINYGK